MPNAAFRIDASDLGKDGELRRRLATAIAMGRDLRPLYKRVGLLMIRSVHDTFQSARDGSGGRAKWPALKDSTLDARRWVADHGGRPYHNKMLVQSGDLKQRQAWEYKTTKSHVDIGTSTPYAGLHQKGGTIKAWGRTTVKVPARTLIQFFRDDLQHIEERSDEYLKETGL